MARKVKRKGKRKDNDECGSDSEAPPKKSSSGEPNDELVVCEIGNNRRVSVKSWQGRVVVDIRQYYDKNGKQLPGRKGISLSMDQWKMLRDHVDKIDIALAESS